MQQEGNKTFRDNNFVQFYFFQFSVLVRVHKNNCPDACPHASEFNN
jgi:hypothetical protein